MEICAKMFAMREKILPANRDAVDRYLQMVWKKVCTLAASFVKVRAPSSLRQRFESYVNGEEERLRRGLEKVKYKIDAINTLSLITGPGRIEKVYVI